MDEYLESVFPMEATPSGCDRRNKYLKTRFLLSLQKLRFPSSQGLKTNLGADLLDSIAVLQSKATTDNANDPSSLLDKIGAHFCQHCGIRRTLDNVRVRLKCDKNIKKKIMKIKAKQRAAQKKKTRQLSKVDKQYLKRCGDYTTTKKTLCLICKFEWKEMVRRPAETKGKIGGEPSILKRDSKPGISVVTSVPEKKLKLMKEKQKFSVKKCSELKRVLSSESNDNGSDDKRKSLKDFLSML